jgi:hypothetical protein
VNILDPEVYFELSVGGVYYPTISQDTAPLGPRQRFPRFHSHENTEFEGPARWVISFTERKRTKMT